MLRIVPWSCREEWLETYHNLYSNEQQMKGIEQVEIWKSRSGSKLPLAVEVTASLIAAGSIDDRAQVSSCVLRHTMAMAIVRFVNGMVDMEQKGAYARSVQSIADEIGLPDWLVDLRHEATHASLPSLEVLRAGHKFALDWLQVHYWESQVAEFCGRDEELVTLLENYAKLRENFKSGKKMRKKDKMLAHEIIDLVGKYDMWQALLDFSFGDKGLLLPSSEILQEMFPEPLDMTTETLFELPEEDYDWLSPLLKKAHKTNKQFLSDFVSFLLRRIHQNLENELQIHFLSCLVHFVLSNCSRKHGQRKRWKINVDLDYVVLLEVCLQNPSAINQHFLPVIIDNLQKLSESLKNKLYKFSTITVAGDNQPRTQGTETLKQHFPEISKQLERRSKETEQDNSVWQQCQPSFASSYEFGAFIGEEPRQKKCFNKEYEKSSDIEAALEDEVPMELCEPERLIGEEDDTENEVENDLTKCDISGMNELTEDMIEEISKNILIF